MVERDSPTIATSRSLRQALRFGPKVPATPREGGAAHKGQTMGKAKTESSRRPVGRARLESIAASITPEEIARKRDRDRLSAMTPTQLLAEVKRLTRKPTSPIQIGRADFPIQVCRRLATDFRMTTRQRKTNIFQGAGGNVKTITEPMVGIRGIGVLWALCAAAHADGTVSVGWKYIQETSKQHPRDVQRGIQELVEGGYIAVERGAWLPNREGRVTVFTILWPIRMPRRGVSP